MVDDYGHSEVQGETQLAQAQFALAVRRPAEHHADHVVVPPDLRVQQGQVLGVRQPLGSAFVHLALAAAGPPVRPAGAPRVVEGGTLYALQAVQHDLPVSAQQSVGKAQRGITVPPLHGLGEQLRRKKDLQGGVVRAGVAQLRHVSE